jgi:hypothetical protein
MQIKKLLLIFITLYLTAFEAVADKNLYSGVIEVPSQGEADRNAAIPDALIQVLQKLTGLREVPLSPTLDEALGSANRMLLSYRYTTTERSGPGGTVSRELRLVANFMQAEVDRLLQQASLPRWQPERPAVQIWVVIDDGRNRELKPLEFQYAWESMEDIAAMRGLPVSWPELDEEEIQLVDMGLVWGGFTDYLVERGAPEDGVAIIAARREGPKWTLRWNLVSGTQKWSWHNSDQELMFALAQGMHRMADQIAFSNAIAGSEQGLWSVDVTIGELNSAEDYVGCLEYLQNLNLINTVDVNGADPGLVHFRLQLNASPEHLVEAFNRGSVLVRSNAGSKHEYEFLP